MKASIVTLHGSKPQFLTNDKCLFGLCSVFVVPRWAAGGVDGSFGGA